MNGEETRKDRIMNIIVCVKQVPDTNDVKIDEETGTLIREGVPSIINPDDKHAIEAALELKKSFGAKVTVMTMGPPQATIALKEAYAMGADETILLSDRAFAGADTWATSYTLGMAIKKIKDYDIIICGRQAIDGDTAQVGPQLAEFLGIPQVTYVRRIDVNGDDITVERALEDGHMTIQVKKPVLLTVISDLNNPRYPHISRIIEAFRKHKGEVWSSTDIKANPSNIGLDGSPTEVKRTFAPKARGEVKFIQGEGVKELAANLVENLKEKNVVR